MDEEPWECSWGKRDGIWVARARTPPPPPAPPAREKKNGGILGVMGVRVGGGGQDPGGQ